MRWTSEQINTAKQLKAVGEDSVFIAATLTEAYGRTFSPGSVLLALSRHDNEAHAQRAADRKAAYFGRRALMIKMYEKGMPLSRIAHALGEAVHAVIYALPDSERLFGAAPPRFYEGPPTRRVYPTISEPRTVAGKSFAEMGDADCKWCIGVHPDDEHMRFCCEPRVVRHDKAMLPYCAAHYPQSIIQDLEEAEKIELSTEPRKDYSKRSICGEYA